MAKKTVNYSIQFKYPILASSSNIESKARSRSRGVMYALNTYPMPLIQLVQLFNNQRLREERLEFNPDERNGDRLEGKVSRVASIIWKKTFLWANDMT